MSAITREEIEQVISEVMGRHIVYPGDRTTVACERVAALVEERMKELVCSVCGKLWPCGDHDLNGQSNWGEPITRAQFEADREG